LQNTPPRPATHNETSSAKIVGGKRRFLLRFLRDGQKARFNICAVTN
jgi:hypothetical protein